MLDKQDIEVSIDEKQLLCFFLSSGISSSKGISIVNKLYSRFSTLYDIVYADENDLLKIEGINIKKVKLLRSIPKLIEYYLLSSIRNNSIDFKRKELIEYLKTKIGGLKFESVVMICLDINRKIISIENIFRGTIDSATIYPRDLVEKALSLGSTYVILSHNHPSGVCNPSKEDISITEMIYKAFLMVNIKLVDHIVVTSNSYYSFRDNGIIDKYKDSVHIKY